MSKEAEAGATGEAEPPRSPRWSWERTNRWLTLAANFGVLLGLIMLIVEVRQNANLTRVMLETERSNAQLMIELRMTEPAVVAVWAKSIETPENLTLAELRTMDGIMAANTMVYDQLLSMMDGDLVSRDRIEQNIKNTSPWVFGSPFGKNWWQKNSVGWQGTPLYEMADPIIRDVSDDFIADFYASLRVAPSMSESSRGPRSAARFTILDLPREAVVPGIVRQRVDGVESTFSRWEIAAGGVVPSHSHFNEQVTLLLSGAAEVVSGEDRFSLRPGDMLVLPPNVPHDYTFTEDSVVIEFFAPRRQDWIDASGVANWAREP